MSLATTTPSTPALATTATSKSGNFWLHFAAGGIGGTVGAAVTCPLEVVKTRMQSSLYSSGAHSAKSSLASSALHPVRAVFDNIKGVGVALRTIRQQEGIFALWKGIGPILIGVVPAKAVYFSVYNNGKHFYSSFNNGRETPIVHMVSAATAGVVTAICTNPIWLVKTRMQLQSDAIKKGGGKVGNSGVYYRNSLHCASEVLRTEGVRGFYKGLTASFLGVSESTIQFVLYEYLKKRLVHEKNEKVRLNSVDGVAGTQKDLEWFNTLGAAAGAKFVATVVTYPHEVLRTRMRQDTGPNGGRYKRLWQTASLVYREEGLAALYGGLTAHVLRVVPNAIILFGTVEFILAVGRDS